MDGLRALLTVLGGALAGGLTNRVAIAMLFRPRRPPRFLGRPILWLQGAVPRNRDRLARAVGGAVGERLLTGPDLAAALRDRDLERAFHRRLGETVRQLLEGDHPPLRDVLPPDAHREVERLLREALLRARPGLARALASGAMEERTVRLARSLAEALDREREEGPLTPARIGALRGRLEAWVERTAASPAFRETVRQQVGLAADRMLGGDRTLEEILPPGAVEALQAAVGGYLPLAMERLGRLLEDPGARSRFEAAVGDLLDRFMEDLRFHQRVVARLVITRETVERVVDTLEREGAERLGELLREPEVQTAMARSVNDAVAGTLRRPAGEVLGRPGDPGVRRFLDAATEWLVRLARDPEARRFLLDRVEAAAWRAGEMSWGDLARALPTARVGRWLADLLESEEGVALMRELAGSAAGALLERPLRTPGDLLGPDASDRLARLLGPPLWDWLAAQLPGLAARVPVARRVEEKIREIPVEELESLIVSVTRRELRTIVRLGYLLGAMVGGVLVAVNALLP